MTPARIVEDAEIRSAMVVTPLIVVLLLVADYGVALTAGVVGLAVGPAATYVKNVAIKTQYRRVGFVLLAVGILAGFIFAGLTTELLWFLIGYNVGTVAVGLYERRVRPLVAA